jgi:hypothetical protein
MRWKAALAVATLVVVAAGTGGSPSAGEEPVLIVPFGTNAPGVGLNEAVTNLECMLGLDALAVYHQLPGFAARLSTAQLQRLERSAVIGSPLVEKGSFLIHPHTDDGAVAERRVAELQQRIGFTVDVGFNRGAFHGWGATLDWQQLDRLDAERGDFNVSQNPSSYVVWFDHLYGGAAVSRAAALGRKYGFKVTGLLAALGGFAATLTNAQLAALSAEPDLIFYTGGGGSGGSGYPWGAVHVRCLHASRHDRRDLAAAFARARPRAAVGGPRGEVLYARLALQEGGLGPLVVKEYAAATFRTRAGGRVTELFRRKPGLRWRDLGPLGKKVCYRRVHREVLVAWLFRPVEPYGCYERT